MKNLFSRVLITPALLTGMGALTAAAVLLLLGPLWSCIPLILYIVSCTVAPFFPRWGYFLPLISRGDSKRRLVALTFDDGPDPVMTPLALSILRQRGIKATFFVTGRQTVKHPDLLQEIIKDGHTVGNHSYDHDVLLMFRSSRRLAQEIDRLQEALSSFGICPLVFRPPVGITNPRLGPILHQRKMSCVNFDCRAFDCGNRRIKGLSGKLLKKVRMGSILLIHDIRYSEKTNVNLWSSELERLLDGIDERGYKVAPLQEVIGRPVMESVLSVA